MPHRKPTTRSTPPLGAPDHIELIARALIELSGHILLCRSRARGHCYLPGGHIEPGESARDALARELLEEANLRIRVGALLLTHEHRFQGPKRPHHELNLVFECRPSTRMFHVEHSGSPRPRPLGRSRPPLLGRPKPVHAVEPHIEFVWVPRRALGGMVPACMATWIRSADRPAWLSDK